MIAFIQVLVGRMSLVFPSGTVIGDWVGWRFTFLFIIIVSVFVGVLMLIYLPKEDELSHPNQTLLVHLVLNHKLAQAS